MRTTPEIPPLSRGDHTTRERGLCYAEAVAWVAGEAHSDQPECMSALLAGFARRLNDTLLPDRDDLEPRLRALVPRSVGTAGRPDLDQRAGLMAMDWLIRVYLPAWLRLAGLVDYAGRLEGGAEITSWEAIPQVKIDAAHGAAYAAARAAARVARAADDAAEATSAAEATARAASRAAEYAAYDAAEDAYVAAGAAARAARAAAYAAAYAAAEDAARAARAAAYAAAEDAAYDAARAAAQGALALTVRDLQNSALDLFGRMHDLWEAPMPLDPDLHGEEP